MISRRSSPISAACPLPGRQPPTRRIGLNLLRLFLLGAGKLPTGKPIAAGNVAAPPKDPTARYGQYIMSYQDCHECHGADLIGGVPGQLAPFGPDLTLVKGWTVDQFITTKRTGVDPNGVQMSEQMPWRPIGRMDDEELTALYLYLTDLLPSRTTRR